MSLKTNADFFFNSYNLNRLADYILAACTNPNCH